MGTFMSQWQGPPYGQAPYPNGPYAFPDYGPQPGGGFMPPPPPPPRNSIAGILIALGVAGLVVIVGSAVVVYLAFGTSSTTAKSEGGSTVPAVPEPSVTHGLPTETPSPLSAPAGGGGGVPNILTATVKTAWKDAYTRTLTRSGTCASVANPALKTALRAHPCAAPVSSALYRTSNRSVQVTITIMKFGSTADATAVLHAAQKKAQPSMISRPRAGVGLWYYNHVQGRYVVFSYACKADGSAPGVRSGPVNVAAVHLGTELTNVLLWEN
jgi:hypothetical protein